MYPYLSDLINDLFGTSLMFPGQTFGFFVAMAFIVAYQVVMYDFKLREKAGQFKMDNIKIVITKPLEMKEVLIQAAIWFIVGYKLGYGIMEWTAFSTNPAEVLLSLKGNIWFGLLGAGIAGTIAFIRHRKTKDLKVTYKQQVEGPSRYMGTIVTIAFFAGIGGAKLFHHLEYLDQLFADPMGQIFSASGLSFLGGLLGAGFFISRFLHKRGYNVLQMMDVFAPCLIIAYAVGRIGCQLSGDGDWGVDNLAAQPAWLSWLPEWTWAFDYPGNVANEGVRIAGCVGDYCNRLVNPVWPTPIYETTMGVIIFAFLWFMRTRFPFIGQITSSYLVLIGLERFLIEQIRVNPDVMGVAFTQAELIAGAMMLVGAGLFVYVTFFQKKPIPNDKNPKLGATDSVAKG